MLFNAAANGLASGLPLPEMRGERLHDELRDGDLDGEFASPVLVVPEQAAVEFGTAKPSNTRTLQLPVFTGTNGAMMVLGKCFSLRRNQIRKPFF